MKLAGRPCSRNRSRATVDRVRHVDSEHNRAGAGGRRTSSTAEPPLPHPASRIPPWRRSKKGTSDLPDRPSEILLEQSSASTPPVQGRTRMSRASFHLYENVSSVCQLVFAQHFGRHGLLPRDPRLVHARVCRIHWSTFSNDQISRRRFCFPTGVPRSARRSPRNRGLVNRGLRIEQTGSARVQCSSPLNQLASGDENPCFSARADVGLGCSESSASAAVCLPSLVFR